jgi:transposase
MGTVVGRRTATGTEPPGPISRWLCSHGEVLAVGVEGTGSWGVGLARFLRARGLNVIEVNRPNRQTRRRKGKSDTVDAEMAARAVLAGDATVTPKTADGPVEALRRLRLARAGAMKARTAAANQLHSLTDTAPDERRARLRSLTTLQRARLCTRLRPGEVLTPAGAAKRALRSVARRWLALRDEITELSRDIKRVLDPIAAPLLERHGRLRNDRHPVVRRRRPPRTTAHRSGLRRALRQRTRPGLIRQDEPSPTQPRRRPPSRLRGSSAGSVEVRDRTVRSARSSAVERVDHRTLIVPAPIRRDRDLIRARARPAKHDLQQVGVGGAHCVGLGLVRSRER